jgi:hypothetical protein
MLVVAFRIHWRDVNKSMLEGYGVRNGEQTIN